MPVHHTRNIYQGVNAHLHSLIQSDPNEDWDGFHTQLITEIARALNGVLPDEYVVDVERALQVKEYHPDSGLKIRRPKPDVVVFQQREPALAVGAAAVAIPDTLTLPLVDTFDSVSEAYYTAVLIRESSPETPRGRIVTRIELLSPSNKIGDDLVIYRQKRYLALKTGVALVEIDLMHHTPSPILGVPRYPQQPDSYPYSIVVSDPTPNFGEARTNVHRFSVDTPLPTFDVPLTQGRFVPLALDPLYQAVFNGLRVYGILVDYAKMPDELNRYNVADQARIQTVMARAQQLASES